MQQEVKAPLVDQAKVAQEENRANQGNGAKMGGQAPRESGASPVREVLRDNRGPRVALDQLGLLDREVNQEIGENKDNQVGRLTEN